MSTKLPAAPTSSKSPTEASFEPGSENAMMLLRFREALDDGIRKRARKEPAEPPKTIYDLKSLG